MYKDVRGVLADHEICDLAINNDMISPFVDDNVGEGVISYGVSSYGYDARMGDEFKIFTNVNNTVVDPKNFSSDSFVSKKGDFCIVPPNSFMLCKTVEYFKIPDDIIVICLGKSTYARCGIIVNVTPLEPGWEGYVTLEFSNTTPLPAKLYANEGACQFIFIKSTPCDKNYRTKSASGGKYMKQIDITPPIVR